MELTLVEGDAMRKGVAIIGSKHRDGPAGLIGLVGCATSKGTEGVGDGLALAPMPLPSAKGPIDVRCSHVVRSKRVGTLAP